MASTFNKAGMRLWMLSVVAAVPTVAAVAVWWGERQLSTLPAMAVLMIVAGVGNGSRLKIPGRS